ncbi:neuron navigator 1 isoform X1 [Lates calcarifer]|uniref:Neuron navigator 1 n=2 Tax=Lates calcarifer TaxID=8187 RepID=A0AAJ8B739_LATCA|nr:neuron navigator 1 isoform X1 [Lates calcarifer]XP_050927174.1 neuron navigator 1 isoform X1 [Lates calcarifer]
MSGGVNVKLAPRGPPSSGIPLPRSLLPSSPKADPRRRASDLPRPSIQTPKHTPTHTPTHTPMHSPSLRPRSSNIPGPSSRDLLRDASLKGQLFQRTGALPAPQVSRSAYSSPLTQRRVTPPHSKDTLDLAKLALAHTPSQLTHDGNRNRNAFTNKNQAWGASNLRPPQEFKRGDNSNSVTSSEVMPGREEESPENQPAQSAMLNNGNLRPSLSQMSCEQAVRHRSNSMSQSDEEMGTPEDNSPVSSPGPLPLPPISFTLPVMSKMAVDTQDQYPDEETESTETNTPKVNMATVAPFSFRLQVQESDFSVDELSDCSSGSIEVCCDDLTPGGMLEANVANISMTAKPRELDLRSAAVSCQDTSAQAMASRKPPPKPSALPQGPSRPSGSELKVYRPSSGSIPIPIPNPSGLRKQRSLSNLSVLTDAEKKLHLYQSPRWNDDTSRPGAGTNKAGQTKTGQAGGGRPPLSRTLSKSEQSLFQGKPKTLCSPALTSNAGKPSRIPAPGKPRGPYAEVKPISKASEVGQSTDTDPTNHPAKANSNGAGSTGSTGTNGKKSAEKGRSASLSTEEKKERKGIEGEDDKGFLKVDPELVVTVLGDLEQLLFSQMLDPESQRKRTVQNVLDLRQNLEETMTSLRGVQLSHSCVEGTMCYDSDEAAAFSISSLSNRSSPLSWRQGQASPRLQAGDAPSTGNAPSDIPLRISHTSRIHLIEALDDSDPALLKGDYLSDSDLGGKSPNEDDEDDDDIDDLGNGWDESSSISSGLSDGSDNLSSEEFNTSPTLNSLPTTPIGSRRNSAIVMRTDAEKRSLVESGLSWDTDDTKPSRKSQGSSVYDTGSLKSESANKWKKTRPQGEGLEGGKGELKKPQTLGQGNVLKKGRNPPVGVTSPITHTSQSGLKVAGTVKSDGKPMDKSRLAVKTSGLQRSSSDAGKDHRNGTSGGEQRKPPSGLVRPSTGGNFGFKKPTTAASNGTNNVSTHTVMSTGGSAIPSGSATVGKIPKTSGIPVKPGAGGSGGGGGRKTSLDVSNGDQTGFLSPNARTSLQYRSLPRPAKTSTLTLTRPSSARPVSTTMDTGSSGLIKPSTTAPQGSRLKEPASGLGSGTGLSKAGGRGIPSPSPVNQTDREKEKERAKAKAVVSDSECGGGSLKGSPAQTPSENGGKLQGLRPPSSGKGIDLPSPNTHRLSGVRSLAKPPSMAQLDKLNSNSLEVGVQDSLPPKIPPYSKLQDLASSAGSSTSPCLTPSPAPLLNVNSSACFSSSGIGLGPRQVSSLGVERSGGSTSPLLYPRLSGLHRSMESLPLQMSLAPEPQEKEKNRERETLVRGYTTIESRDKERQEDRGPPASWSSGSKVSLTLTDSSQRDRNTLPKKGLSFSGAPQVEEEGKEKGERRHSHTILSMTDSLTLPLLSSPTSLPRTSKTSMVPSPVGGPPRMTRSNSIPTHDASMELYGASPLGSTLSLAERPRSMGMVRSGSFRDKESDEVHGSALSLASNASSSYSSYTLETRPPPLAEERIQGEQIRKLRRELESSQEKVSNLTTQLTANANLVAAFEQSLALMTTRLQSLSISHEQKDSELSELRETIEALRARNEEAQAVIQGALNTPDNMKDMRMRRQNSCESISSLNSLTSISSVGSLKDQDAKKKKKKSWLRSSFNKAFSIKKGSKTYSDIEEIATPDSSAPNSPKMLHEGGEGGENQPSSLKTSASATSSVIMETTEEGDNEETAVTELRSELWVKERELTDIRLEALNSAHQLEQLREAMNNMQSTVENLKAENDHLKTGSQLHLAGSGPTSSTSQPSGLASLLGPSLRQPVSMSLTKSFSLSLNDCKDPDVSPVDMQSVSSHRDEVCARVLVRIGDQAEDSKQQQEYYLGSVPVSARTEWTCLDSLIAKTFKDYLTQVDPTASLGLSCDSLHTYQLTQGGQRVIGGDKPQASPYRCLSNGSAQIFVTLKGLREKCVDSLVFETLIPKPMMLHYISLLLKHRRLVLSGPSGTGKTYLAQRLAHYLLQRSHTESSEADHEPCLLGRSAAVTFNMHRQSQKELQLYLSNLANQIDRESGGELPLVVIIDDISDSAAITELVNGALTCKYHKCPYIIGTTNQPVKMSSNHGLHLSFRMVMFSNNVEPANGFLVRYLHRKAVEAYQEEEQDPTRHQALLCVLDWVPQLWYHLHTFLEKHSTSDFLIGPCFFLSCPVSVAEFRQWFIDLWNHSIIPYLQEGAKDGIKVHGQKAVWEDPVEWVRGTLPWPNAQQDQSRLFHLPPPSIAALSEEKKPPKDTPPPSTLESDPLMAMLLKLQESANYIESPEREGSLDLQATL